MSAVAGGRGGSSPHRGASSRKLIVEADGGSRGNPGPAGYGALVRDALTGEVLAEVAESIGHATNNVAEYRGLIAGLTAAADLDPSARVEVRMDSKLVVEQMSGRWKIKHPDMIPLALRAKELAGGLGSVSYGWIPRNRNAHADRLANEAMDAAARGEHWTRKVEEAPREPEPPPRPPSSAPMTTVLLRHGETPLSIEKRFAGIGDVPLTPNGLAQARAAALALKDRGLDAIVTSPLARCRDTAAPPGGESFAQVSRRVRTALDKLKVRYREQTVLVVSHVTPIKLLVKDALGAPMSSLYRMHLDVAALSSIDWYPDGPATLRTFNDVHHLPS